MPPARRLQQAVEDLLPVGLADDSHAQPLTEGDELLEEVIGLETLGHSQDGGELTAGPGSDEVPVAHVRQGHDDAARTHVLAQLGIDVGAHARQDLLRCDSGQGEGLVEVAHVGTHAGSGGPVQRGRWCSRREDA